MRLFGKALKSLAGSWNSYSLSVQFAVAGGVIMLFVMAFAGHFLSAWAAKAAIEREAASSALLVESLIAPLVEELAGASVLGPSNTGAIDNLMSAQGFRQRFPHLDIWKDGGLISYSTTSSLAGRMFPMPVGLRSALKGMISARYTDLEAREHTVRGFTRKFLEIYVPVRENREGRIIAVAEIHEVTDDLDAELSSIRRASWLGVAGGVSLIMLALFAVVFRGDRKIIAQQRELNKRFSEIKTISRQNENLRERVQKASGRLSEITENYMRKVGAELHDGPGQLLAFACLKVEHVRRAETPAQRDIELTAIELAVSESLSEIRAMSQGLMLPEIVNLSIRDIVQKVVRIHQVRSDATVCVNCTDSSVRLSHAIKICVYRFLQEGLNNAQKHASGDGLSVFCEANQSELTIAVESFGEKTGSSSPSTGLGLLGLRERVESLGGVFRIGKVGKNGVRVEMSLSIDGGG